MEVSVEIYISGQGFNPQNFNEDLPETLKGSVKEYKKTAYKRVGKKNYWLSVKTVPIDMHPSEVLKDFINLYAPYWSELLAVNYKKYANIIVKYRSVDEIGGFFIDKELISVCNIMGIEIDIDVYTDFE